MKKKKRVCNGHMTVARGGEGSQRLGGGGGGGRGARRARYSGPVGPATLGPLSPPL